MYSGRDLGDYFKRGLHSFLFDEVPSEVVKRAGVMGQVAKPDIPWYMYESIGDNLSPVRLADNLYDNLCAKGAQVQYDRNIANLSHFEEGFIGFKGAIEWIKDRQAGKDNVAKGCVKTTSNIKDLLVVAPYLLSLYSAEFQGMILELFTAYMSVEGGIGW